MAQTRAFHGSVETVLFLLLQLLCCLLLGPGLLGREYNDLNVLSDSETEQVKPLCMFLISSIAANRRHLVNRCHTRYTKSSFHYYSNSTASFNFELLRLGGDISLNPVSQRIWTPLELDPRGPYPLADMAPPSADLDPFNKTE